MKETMGPTKSMSKDVEKFPQFEAHDAMMAKHGAGHLPHHKFFKEHAAGHEVHTDAVQKMCGGGYMGKKSK